MLQTVVLALLQSATEFLPVSSSGHLILLPRLLNWPDQGMATDIALHVGTLLSVLIYFRRDVMEIVNGCFDCAKRNFSTFPARFVSNLAVASVPVFIVGFFCHKYIAENFRSPRLVALTAIVFGILLYVADKKGKSSGTIRTMGMKDAFLIGSAQILALIPGVSRSGITITAARCLGIDRAEAARFSMLLSVPTIGAAGILGVLEIIKNPATQLFSTGILMTGVFVSFAGGMAAIGFLMRYLKTSSFVVFAVYRILLGCTLFYLF